MNFEHKTYTSDAPEHAGKVLHAKVPVRDGSVPLDDMPAPMYFGFAVYPIPQLDLEFITALVGRYKADPSIGIDLNPSGALMQINFDIAADGITEAFDVYATVSGAKIELMKADIEKQREEFQQLRRKPKISVAGANAVKQVVANMRVGQARRG